MWFCKHESPSGQSATFFHLPLQSAELACGEICRTLMLQAFEELLGRPIGFTLQPQHDLRPSGLEGIRARSPVARRLGLFAVRRPDLALPPGVPETLAEAIEIGVSTWKLVDAFAGGEPGEVMLDRSNFIEKP